MKTRCTLAVFITAASLTLSGCSTPKLAKLDSCDGKNRRTANPNGVTLPGVPSSEGKELSGQNSQGNLDVFERESVGTTGIDEVTDRGQPVVPPLLTPQSSVKFSNHIASC